MNIDDYHRVILLLEDKGQTTWHPPDQIDDCIHRSQMDLYNYFAPLYGKDETAKKGLDPFVTKFIILGGNSTGGLINLPGDPSASPCFGHLLSGTAVSFNNQINPSTGQPYGTQYWPIEFINDDELPFRLKSQIKPVSLDKPIATSAGSGVIQLWPQQPNSGWITYLRIPTPPKYAYTTPVNPRALVYDPTNSVQLVWNDSFATKIISRALIYLGVNIDDDKIIQIMGQIAAA
jgi:hypothetical protein